MDIQDIMVYLIVFLCIVYAGKNIFRSFGKKSSSHSCCCSGCPGCPHGKKTQCPECGGGKN
jgi:hypothetical protein